MLPTRAFSSVMRCIFDWLIADVAKQILTFGAINHVIGSFFLNNLITAFVGTSCAKFKIYPLNVFITMLSYDLFCHAIWKKCSFVWMMIRLLFVMFLSLSWRITSPTKVVIAFYTLNLCATRLIFAYWNTALRIWATLCAILHEKLIQNFLWILVFL